MNNFELPRLSNEKKQELIEKAEEIERIMLTSVDRTDDEKEEYYNLFRNYFEKNGAVEYDEWQGKLQEIENKSGKIIVRREDPEKIFKSLDNKSDIHINVSREHGKQPNAAKLGSGLDGLRLALAGGFGKVGRGSVVLTMGFEDTGKIEVEDLPKEQFINFQGDERKFAKIINGTIPFKDVKFFLVRMPYDFFPEDEMTDYEIKRTPAHIQRIYVFENK